MNLNTYNISEDWGWYVDTESNLFINSHNFDVIVNKPYKKINYHYINLDKIEEQKDEYEYYKKNYRDIEQLELDSIYIKSQVKNEKKYEEMSLYKIGSTTLISALLTYVVFFLI